MIALVKLYKGDTLNDNGKQIIKGQVFSILKNNQLIGITDVDIAEHFIPDGMLFVPNKIEIGKKKLFGLYHIDESEKYDETKANSKKYLVSEKSYEHHLYEVIDIDEKITDEAVIRKYLREGIKLTYYLSNSVIFRTSDDYLIGPLDLKYLNETDLNVLRNKSLKSVAYYENYIDIFKVNVNKEEERLFTINSLNSDYQKGEIDLASDDEVISEIAQEILEFPEQRKMTEVLVNYINQRRQHDSSELVKLDARMQRALHILEGLVFNAENRIDYKEELLKLPFVDELIKWKSNQKFEEKQGDFHKKMKILEQQYIEMVGKLEDRELSLIIVEERLDLVTEQLAIEEKKAGQQLAELEQAKNKKIIQIERDIYEVYLDQLLSKKIAKEIDYKEHKSHNQSVYPTTAVQFIENSMQLCERFKHNLMCVNGIDKRDGLIATLIGAIYLRQPIIIKGKYSFDFSQVIAQTLAGGATYSYIPEIETFSLHLLTQELKDLSRIKGTKAFILNNISDTTALYSVPTYIKQQKWQAPTILPDLFLIPVKSGEEAHGISEKMLASPVIDSDLYISTEIRMNEINQLDISNVDFIKLQASVQKVEVVDERFSEWLNRNGHTEVKANGDMEEWVDTMLAFEEEAVVYEQVFQMFKHNWVK